jgi:hypothetical protein
MRKSLKKLTKYPLISLISLSLGSCSFLFNNDLERYAFELYYRDFAHLEKSPKGFDAYPIGMFVQYRDKGCFFLYGNHLNDIWIPFLKLARKNIGEEEYKSREKRFPYSGGYDLFEYKELAETCLEIDSNSVNGNNDHVAHPEETRATLNQFFPGKTIEYLKIENRKEFFNHK